MFRIKSHSIFMLISTFLCMAIISCGFKEENLVNIESSYTNQQILLKVAGILNSFKTDDPIFLELYYNTSKEIIFPSNYNLRIFYKNSDEWIEIKEKPTQRFPGEDIVFSPTQPMSYAESVVLAPDLPNKLEKYHLRIYVVGNMNEEGKIIQVTAYTEIELSP